MYLRRLQDDIKCYLYRRFKNRSYPYIRSGEKIITDAPVDNEGKGAAFSPTDLAATSLATCMLTIMGIAARNRDIDMKGKMANVTKSMAADPRAFIGKGADDTETLCRPLSGGE